MSLDQADHNMLDENLDRIVNRLDRIAEASEAIAEYFCRLMEEEEARRYPPSQIEAPE